MAGLKWTDTEDIAIELEPSDADDVFASGELHLNEDTVVPLVVEDPLEELMNLPFEAITDAAVLDQRPDRRGDPFRCHPLRRSLKDLRTQDGQTGFKIGRLDIGGKTPLEARTQSLFKRHQRLR